MSDWLELTGPDGRSQIYVNMAVATHVVPERTGARICFAGSNDSQVIVAELPEQVIEKLDQKNRADRA